MEGQYLTIYKTDKVKGGEEGHLSGDAKQVLHLMLRKKTEN